jgi:Flp pilus assembly protein TadB
MSFFDLRRPLGWLFSTLGILLVVAGLRPTPAAGARSLGININLIWGVAMITFALVCLWLARREARRRTQAASSSPK